MAFVTTKLIGAVAVAVSIAGADAVRAGEPVELSLDQLDTLTAAGPFSFTFTKFNFASNFEAVAADVNLDGSILQSSADVQANIVQIGTGNDIKVETATDVSVLRAPVFEFVGLASLVQANSLSFIAFE